MAACLHSPSQRGGMIRTASGHTYLAAGSEAVSSLRPLWSQLPGRPCRTISVHPAWAATHRMRLTSKPGERMAWGEIRYRGTDGHACNAVHACMFWGPLPIRHPLLDADSERYDEYVHRRERDQRMGRALTVSAQLMIHACMTWARCGPAWCQARGACQARFGLVWARACKSPRCIARVALRESGVLRFLDASAARLAWKMLSYVSDSQRPSPAPSILGRRQQH